MNMSASNVVKFINSYLINIYGMIIVYLYRSMIEEMVDICKILLYLLSLHLMSAVSIVEGQGM